MSLVFAPDRPDTPPPSSKLSLRTAPLEPKALDAAVFLLLAFSLSIPSGYSWGAVLLLLLGLYRWPAVLRGRVSWPRDMRFWAGAIFIMGMVWSLHIVVDGKLVTNSLGVDRSIKYLLVFLTLPALLIGRPSERALNWGCWTGAIGAGLTALWQIGILGWDRAAGYTNAIQFGNLALLLAAWSGARALRAPQGWQKAVGWIAVLLGTVASVASGSRGGWLTLPALMLLIFWLKAPPPSTGKSFSHALRAAAFTLVACGALLALPPVQQRVSIGIDEWQAHELQAENTSVGLRRSFWKLALEVGEANAWLGAGQDGYETLQKEAVGRGEMPDAALEFNHAHNEWLDMFAKRGLLGIAGLAIFFIVPGLIFARGLRREPEEAQGGTATNEADERRAVAACGLMTVLGFAGFGLTQVMFAHNNGNMMYLLMVTIWLACLQHSKARS